jgi:hypothetical protein
MTDMRKADARAQRQALLLVLAVGAIGSLLIVGFENWLERLPQALLTEPGELKRRLRIGLILLAAVSLLPLGGLAIYLWRLGGKVYKAGEYPPPNCRLFRDAPVVRGKTAIFRARALKAAACVLLAATGLSGWLFLRIFNAFGI